MRQIKHFEFRGERLTADEIAERTGLCASQVRKRTDGERFYEDDEIAAFDDEPTASNRMITFRGETRTLASWADKTGIPRVTIAHRLNAGWTVLRALTTRPRIPKRFEFAGRNLTLPEWARLTGIPLAALRERIRKKHWTLARVLTEPSLTARERGLIAWNRKCIARMSDAFGPSSPTGGYAQTSRLPQGTGGRERADHLHGARP